MSVPKAEGLTRLYYDRAYMVSYWSTIFGDILPFCKVDFVIESAVIYLLFGNVTYALCCR